jgi:hypothetical protein
MPYIYTYCCNGLAPQYAPDWKTHLLHAVVDQAWAQRDQWLTRGWSPIVELPQPVLGQGCFAGRN